MILAKIQSEFLVLVACSKADFEQLARENLLSLMFITALFLV